MRRHYVDWLRGVAVLLMIMWHSIDAWHEPGNRGTGAFLTVAFLAGWPAPLFLFLAGLSMALAGAARLASGLERREVTRGLARRGWQVFLIAHLFRLQSFLLNPNASWNAILKPDILNVLGLGMVFSAWLWGHATTPRERVYWLLAPAVAIAFVITPLAPTWWWPTLLYPRLEAYVRPVGNQGQFSLFPAVAFVVAGIFAGSFLGDRRSREAEGQFHRQALGVGLALMLAGITMDAAPGFWTIRWIQSGAIVAWRSGAILTLLALSFWWLGSRAPGRWHPLLVFGQTSLFVYWIHVELAYGSLSYGLRQSLTFPAAVFAYLTLTAVMYAAAVLWRRRPPGPLIPPHLRATRSSSLGFRRDLA